MILPCSNKETTSFYQKGYTLIEILIVVAIIGFMTSIGIASYNSFNEQRVVKRAADELKTYLRLAAGKANNNEKDCQACNGVDNVCATSDDEVLTAWYLELSPTLRIYGLCNGTQFGERTFLDDISGLTITADVNTIAFFPLNQGTDLAEALTIRIALNDDYFDLEVDPSGNISDLSD